MRLLSEGFIIRGVAVTVAKTNPFMIFPPPADDETGDRVVVPDPTKLFVSNIPISYSDNEILQTLIKDFGVIVVSKLIAEKDRDARGGLTHWKTGRRFVYIAVPEQPLPKQIQIGQFNATLYHKEQRTAQRQANAECRRCLEKGHVIRDCTELSWRCRQCMKFGHRAGDPECQMIPDNVFVKEMENITTEDLTKDKEEESSSSSSKDEAEEPENEETESKEEETETKNTETKSKETETENKEAETECTLVPNMKSVC